MAQVKERPIIFSDSMVRAILAGRKTQTRRIVKPQPEGDRPAWAAYYSRNDGEHCWIGENPAGSSQFADSWPKPRMESRVGVPGDRLWVRESYRAHMTDFGETIMVNWKADDSVRDMCVQSCERWEPQQVDWKWKPSIHMPRWASRITLEVTGVRVERVQDISEEDILAEGAFDTTTFQDARGQFANLWNEINGDGAWARNDWVWVVEFQKFNER